ncbi:cytochrome P450 [Kineosporia babensis]|uniref:Cytochrome P450 n=1 Tax=Kineosporia babensis TaxID=499548 RepID=A0A9X1NK97_9ACTN|nr:cytochrome P450 [Kineosporia babensis]
MSVVDRYNPLDADTLANPYPLLSDLRREAPVFWHEGMQSWVLTRYADCVRVLRDHQTFARDPRRSGRDVPAESQSVQTLDPPEQGHIRSLFMNALHAQPLLAVEARTRRFAKQRLDELTDREEFDVIAELAVPLSLSLMGDLLGVKTPPYQEFAEVSDAIMRSMDGGLNPALVEPGRKARQELSDLVDGWYAGQRGTGLLAQVRRATRDDKELVQLYVKNTARVMFQGGYSTMSAAIGNSIGVLLTHPEILERLKEGGPLGTAVDELVRFDGPVQGTTRVALVSAGIGGVQIAPGQKVIPLFVAANRDPDAFAEPDRILPERSPNPHLGYGWGTHACIGTTAAAAGLRALISALADHPAHLEPVGTGKRRPTATMRAFDVLPAALRI